MPDLKYPFCVLDVDGTLTFAYDDFHPAIPVPVQEYRRRGGVVALLSGRLPEGMRRAVQWLDLGAGTLLGGGDGAVCARLAGDGSFEWLWQNALDAAQLLPGLIRAGEPGVALTPGCVIAVGDINKVPAGRLRQRTPLRAALHPGAGAHGAPDRNSVRDS